MRYIKILSVFIFALMMSSCGGTEPNDLAYTVAIGFDKAETKDNYIITIQFAKPTQISGGGGEEGGKDGNEIVENIAVEAPNLYAGLGLANSIVSKNFSLSHAKLIVLSAEVAKEGAADIIKIVSHNEEIRPDIYLAVAKNSAREYLYEVSPAVEINPSKYYQLIYDENLGSGLSSNSALEVSFNYKNKNASSVLPLAGVAGSQAGGDTVLPQKLDLGNDKEKGVSYAEEKKQEQERADKENSSSSEKSQNGESGGETNEPPPEKTENNQQNSAKVTNEKFEFRLRDYIAGQASVNSNNKSEVSGMVVFKEDKAKFIAGVLETELYKILVGDLDKTYLTLDCGGGDAVTLKTEQGKKPRVKIDRKNRKIKIELFLESNLYSMPEHNMSEADIKQFEEKAKRDIGSACEKFINEIIRENKTDILNFGRKFKRYFLTNKDYEQHKDEIMDYDVSVEPNFVIRRTGLTLWED